MTNAELRKSLDSLGEDAARYRWLRAQMDSRGVFIAVRAPGLIAISQVNGHNADQLIDAEMRSANSAQSEPAPK